MGNEDIDAEAPMNRGELEKMVDALVVAAIAKAAPKEEPEEESLRTRLRRERDEHIQRNRDKRNPVAEDLIEPPGKEDKEMPQDRGDLEAMIAEEVIAAIERSRKEDPPPQPADQEEILPVNQIMLPQVVLPDIYTSAGEEFDASLVRLFQLKSVVTPPITGHLIATHSDGAGLDIDINETITTLAEKTGTTSDTSKKTWIYTNEAGEPVEFDVPTGTESSLTYVLSSGHQIFKHNSGAPNALDVPVYETITTLLEKSGTSSDTSKTTWEYTNEAGAVVEFDVPTGTTSTLTPPITGHTIATHNSGAAGAANVEINETITDLSLSGSTLTYSREAGADRVIELPDGLPTGTNGQILRNVSGVWTAVDVTEVTLSYCASGTPTTGTFLKL